MNRSTLRVLLPVAVLSLGLLAAETVVRSLRVTRLDGTFHEPGGTLRYGGGLGCRPQPKERWNLVRWNSAGEYDREWPLSGEGSPERVVLGDSFVEAIQVPLEQHASTLLGAAKLGTSGHGPVQEANALERARGRGWRPREVVLVFCAANDLRNSLDHDHPFRTGLWCLDLPIAAMTPNWGCGGEWDAAWARMLWALARIRALSPQLVVALATEGLPNGPVIAWCESARVPWVDCTDAETIPDDGHWSARGHATTAERVSRVLGERP